jgi:hypothetical protein
MELLIYEQETVDTLARLAGFLLGYSPSAGIISDMRITLELTPPQAALLKALAPRGAAAKTANPLENTALRILAEGMQREGMQRRISWDQIGARALTEAVKARKERMQT